MMVLQRFKVDKFILIIRMLLHASKQSVSVHRIMIAKAMLITFLFDLTAATFWQLQFWWNFVDANTCRVLGFLLEVGIVNQVVWSLCLAFIFVVVNLQLTGEKIPKYYIPGVAAGGKLSKKNYNKILLILGLLSPAISITFGILGLELDGYSGSIDGWCWLTNPMYQREMLYIPALVAVVIDLGVYIWLLKSAKNKQNEEIPLFPKTEEMRLQDYAWLFLSFVVVWTPAVVTKLFELAGYTSAATQIIHDITAPSSGFVSFIVMFHVFAPKRENKIN